MTPIGLPQLAVLLTRMILVLLYMGVLPNMTVLVRIAADVLNQLSILLWLLVEVGWSQDVRIFAWMVEGLYVFILNTFSQV